MIRIGKRFLTLLLLIMGVIHSTEVLAQTKVTIAFQIPLEHHLARNVVFFKQELETISNKTVDVIINDYGSYIRDIRDVKDQTDQKDFESENQYFMEKDMLEAVKNRKVEVGMISLARLSRIIPLADIFNQPFLVDSEKKAADAVARGSVIRESIENSLKNLGVTALWWQPYGSVILVSKGSSVHNPEQMKDKKVRVFGETLGNVVLASGGIPLAIPNSLQYFAYDHKKVDIGMTTIADVKTKKIWEVMDTISLTNNANMQFLMIANNSWWNSLNPNLRKFISRAALTTEEKSVEMLKSIEVSAYKEAIENGMTIVLLSNDDRDYWKEKSSPVYKSFLDKTGSKGQLAFDSISGY